MTISTVSMAMAASSTLWPHRAMILTIVILLKKYLIFVAPYMGAK
jgi:hypothetical protein